MRISGQELPTVAVSFRPRTWRTWIFHVSRPESIAKCPTRRRLLVSGARTRTGRDLLSTETETETDERRGGSPTGLPPLRFAWSRQ
ncbi:hypothetical protein GCM10010121_031390 [Streptomyces brasiliensis]|uniref:Uncharacterized protein n=1 Tax=Streptomyces brasiliensis TaxID=1954 RepID=A0A917KPE4_9ACTN|nr:hypothetical protein GCM10010121_031390 [Streptomyces brasiliensis]